jgi:hypothetical protein
VTANNVFVFNIQREHSLHHMPDVPGIEVELMPSRKAPVRLGGPATTVVAPAIANAIFRGCWRADPPSANLAQRGATSTQTSRLIYIAGTVIVD